MSVELTGGCLCGAIRYCIDGAPFDADYCHCRMCQQQTGAPVSAWMDFKVGQVHWLKGKVKEFASSGKVRRGFCPECGSTLTFRDTGYVDYLTLSITSLDNPALVSPRYHIYTQSALDWHCIDDSLPRYGEGRSG